MAHSIRKIPGSKDWLNKCAIALGVTERTVFKIPELTPSTQLSFDTSNFHKQFLNF